MSTAAPRVGEPVGPYRILSFIGQGGGGVVYRAWDPRLEREVALKVLPRRPGGDPGRAERFVAEARAASALNHPNIVTVFDAAFDNDTLYIVSEGAIHSCPLSAVGNSINVASLGPTRAPVATRR